jgi:O-Antigen ligase
MPGFFSDKRNYLTFGVCLPFAVLLGYHLADINDPVSKFVFAAAIAGLCSPLLIRWYHPLLVLSWNMTAQVAFLPGAPLLWAFLSLVGLFFAILNRSLHPDNKFAHVPSLTMPMLFFAVVILVTAEVTGGINVSTLGATASQGGRKYFYVLAAIIGFFGLTSMSISKNKALLYVMLFYLSGLTTVLNLLAAWIGPAGDFIYYFFPGQPDDPFVQTQSAIIGERRIGEMMAPSFAIFSWMLAKYGVQGVFDLTRPFRLIVFLAAISLGFLGGFRSHLIMVVMTFAILFFVERLWRTHAMLVVALIGTLIGITLMTSADKLPPTIQRCFSFLPVEIDPMIKMQAESSSQWRIDLWKQVVDEVPIYFFKGKGYSFSTDEMYMALFNQNNMGAAGSGQGAAVAGDYHNGPLSLLIPFGVYGLVAFVWLAIAGILYLYKNYQYGDPELRTVNAFLFACFTARVIFFFAVFGAISSDLYVFTGMLGLSVALNARKKNEPLPEGALGLQTSIARG